MSQFVLDWVEAALRAERQSLDLVLQLRHQRMMEALALELDGVKWKNSVPPIAALEDPSSPRGQFIFDTDTLVSPRAPRPSQDSNTVANPPGPLQTGLQLPPAIGDHGPHDEPGDQSKLHSTRERVKSLLNNSWFETFIGVVIVVNSVLMGVEAQLETEGKDLSVLHALEHFFLACYTCELCLWFFAYGFSIVFQNGWVAFDCLLVVFGILGSYIIAPLVEHLKDSNDETLKDTLAGLMVMRMMRLFRLARILRVLVVFKVLWMLVRGLIGSAGTIAYTMGLIFVIVYMFACMSIELITKKHRHTEDDRIAGLVANHFADLPVTILSLLQFVSVDGIAELYFPLVKADPFLIVFFLPFILIVSVALMNLVTAVIVEGAIEQGKQDREAMARYRQYSFKKLQPHLRAMFNAMDRDGSSRLTRDELLSAPEKVKQELQDYMQSGSESLLELFEMIDVDESGEVEIEEFCDGVGKLVYSDAPVELIRVLKQLKIVRKQLDVLHPRNKSLLGRGRSSESLKS